VYFVRDKKLSVSLCVFRCAASWDFIDHDKARSNAYRWGEEGIAGFVTPRNPMFSAFWNGKDAILKELVWTDK
jgi:hypothetical protein